MKKEGIIKNMLLKSLLGIPLGITLLVIAYASVYFIAGKDIFNSELNQLHNINIFICQFICVGISGYMLSIIFYIFSTLQDSEYVTKRPYISIFTMMMCLIMVFIITTILGNTNIFSKNIGILMEISLVLVYASSGIVFFIRSAKEDNIIKDINNKIKENKK